MGRVIQRSGSRLRAVCFVHNHDKYVGVTTDLQNHCQLALTWRSAAIRFPVNQEDSTNCNAVQTRFCCSPTPWKSGCCYCRLKTARWKIDIFIISYTFPEASLAGVACIVLNVQRWLKLVAEAVWSPTVCLCAQCFIHISFVTRWLFLIDFISFMAQCSLLWVLFMPYSRDQRHWLGLTPFLCPQYTVCGRSGHRGACAHSRVAEVTALGLGCVPLPSMEAGPVTDLRPRLSFAT